jgi:transcriptional regulator with XRE-family HTH domain
MSARLKHTAENLKRSLISKGYSQVQLAEETGLNRATVNNYFTGKQEPFQESFIKLAEKLGHEPEFLVVKQEEHPADPNAFLTPLELRVLDSVNQALDRLTDISEQEPASPMLRAAEMPPDERAALTAEMTALLAKLPIKGVRQSLMIVQGVVQNYAEGRAAREKNERDSG